MAQKFKVKSCEQTCSACPSEWDIFTTDDQYIYVRYRWGGLTLTFDFDGPNEKIIYAENIGGGFDGCMSTEELKQHTKDILDWSLV